MLLQLTEEKCNLTELLVVKFHGIFRDKFAEKTADFAGIFKASFAEKRLVKNGQFRESFPSKFRWKAIGFALI